MKNIPAELLSTVIVVLGLSYCFPVQALTLPELLHPGISWVYYTTATEDSSRFRKNLRKVQVAERSESNDTVFITTTETQFDTIGELQVSQNDTVFHVCDTVFRFRYVIVPANGGAVPAHRIVCLDTNFLITAAGKRFEFGYLSVIYPFIYYSDGSQFPTMIGNAAYGYSNDVIFYFYQETVGLIYQSMTAYPALGTSSIKILSYNDSLIDAMDLLRQFREIQVPVTRLRTAPVTKVSASAAPGRYDLLGRNIDIDRMRYRTAAPVITLFDGRGKVDTKCLFSR